MTKILNVLMLPDIGDRSRIDAYPCLAVKQIIVSEKITEKTKLIYLKERSISEMPYKAQHLYFISSEKIKEKDYFLWISGMQGNKEIHQYHSDAGYAIKTYTDYNPSNESSILVNHSGYLGKIIATTDKSLGLPLISQLFVEEYAKQQGSFKEMKVKYYPDMDEFTFCVTNLDGRLRIINSLGLDEYLKTVFPDYKTML